MFQNIILRCLNLNYENDNYYNKQTRYHSGTQ
jgi:hypothetical protein